MLIGILALILATTLPPVNPQVPLVLYQTTTISVTSNTQISNAITLVTPQAVGYSSWAGNFRVSTAILLTVAPGAGDTNGHSEFPTAGSDGWFKIKQ